MFHWSLQILGVFTLTLGLGYPLRAQTHPYELTPERGKYMLLVKSYEGESAAKLTHRMITELREIYELPAYYYHRPGQQKKIHQRISKLLANQERGLKQLGIPVWEGSKPQRFFKVQRSDDQFAVLVGGFPDMETAQQELKNLRKLKPPSKELLDRAVQDVPIAETKRQVQGAYLNPFASAFIVPNPTLPKQDIAAEKKPDPSWKKLNANEPFSVLECDKPWTLVVRVYQGAAMIATDSEATKLGLKQAGLSEEQARHVTVCGLQAHRVAEWLRDLHKYQAKTGNSIVPFPIDAYVLHTPHMSVVTVGQFDAVDDPRIDKYRKVIAGLQMKDQKSGIVYDQFLDKPLPMQVPKFED